MVLRAGIFYFLTVFAAGFLLGIVRTLWIVPRLGVRWAELSEMPVMFAVIVLAARAASRRLEGEPGKAATLYAGLVALALLLACEFGLVLWIRGLTITEYFAERDPVSGSVYALMLVFFAIAPTLFQISANRVR